MCRAGSVLALRARSAGTKWIGRAVGPVPPAARMPRAARPTAARRLSGRRRDARHGREPPLPDGRRRACAGAGIAERRPPPLSVAVGSRAGTARVAHPRRAPVGPWRGAATAGLAATMPPREASLPWPGAAGCPGLVRRARGRDARPESRARAGGPSVAWGCGTSASRVGTTRGPRGGPQTPVSCLDRITEWARTTRPGARAVSTSVHRSVDKSPRDCPCCPTGLGSLIRLILRR